MIRMNTPEFEHSEFIDVCLQGISGLLNLKNRLIADRQRLLDLGDQYRDKAQIVRLWEFGPVIDELAPLPGLAGLSKADLNKVYNQYFVPEIKPARKFYDAIKNSAQEKCPYCGIVNASLNLDHFLPISHFPQFGILPLNLVPICKDCNTEYKKDYFATLATEELMHPYFAAPLFYGEQWIFARLKKMDGQPAIIEYYADAPENWSDVDKRRVENHFTLFQLDRRYAIKAAEHLGLHMAQIIAARRIGITDVIAKEIVLKPLIDHAPFRNHWHVGLGQALAESNFA